MPLGGRGRFLPGGPFQGKHRKDQLTVKEIPTHFQGVSLDLINLEDVELARMRHLPHPLLGYINRKDFKTIKRLLLTRQKLLGK